MKTKIAVNTRFLIENKLEGIGWFTYHTLKHMTQNHPEIEWHFFFDRQYPDEFIFADNIVPHVLMPQARHPLLWFYWFEHVIPSKLRKTNADLFFSTDGFCSLKAQTPTAMVIHDLAFEHFEDHVQNSAGRFYKKNSPKYARKAESILTVSEFSRQDIHQQYDIDLEKITVVHNGVSDVYQPLSDIDRQGVRNTHSFGKDYFLYAGSIHPRKNVARLFQAFDAFKEKTNADVKLLMAGRKAWKTGEAMQAYETMRFKDDVVFLGHLSSAELAKVMASALALTYVSLFEGFGIPIVEAMQCEVPVITSNVSSMKEVGGNAALLVNPESVPEITTAMESIYQNRELRDALIQRANTHVKQFSWEKTAERCWEVLERTLVGSEVR